MLPSFDKKTIDKFYNMLLEQQPVLEFEKWVYNSEELEEILDEDSYLDFISLNYKKSGAYYDLKRLIEKQIDKTDYLKWEMITQLERVKSRKGDYHHIIIEFYHQYCRGYQFLDGLAFEFGLSLEYPNDFNPHSYEDLSQETRNKIVDDFYPQIISEIDLVLSWIKNNQIILKVSDDIDGYLNYEDLRIKKKKNYEKLPKKTPIEKKINVINSKSKWWEFWK